MGLKRYHRLVLPILCYPGMNDCNHTNGLHAISPAVLPADHGIYIPPSFPNGIMLLPPPILPTNVIKMAMKKNGSDVEGHWMDLIRIWCKDGTITFTNKVASISTQHPPRKHPLPPRERPVWMNLLPPRGSLVWPLRCLPILIKWGLQSLPGLPCPAANVAVPMTMSLIIQIMWAGSMNGSALTRTAREWWKMIWRYWHTTWE